MRRREDCWIVEFDEGVYLSIECLWRLLEGGRITRTSDDDEQVFGLTSPIDAAAEVTRRAEGKKVVSVDLVKGTLDLTLVLEAGLCLQALPISSGYEAWEVGLQGKRIIALGGGEVSRQ